MCLLAETNEPPLEAGKKPVDSSHVTAHQIKGDCEMSIFASFHEQQMSSMRINKQLQETRAALIDAMADDLYAEKLQALPNGQAGSNEYRSRPGYNIWSVINDLDQVDLIPVARAIIANDEAEVGRLIIKLVTAQLRKEAAQEADDYDDENHPRIARIK